MKKIITVANEYALIIEGPYHALEAISCTLFDTKEFKTYLNNEINECYEEIKKVHLRRTRLVDTPPYTITEEEDSAIKRIVEEYKQHIRFLEKTRENFGKKYTKQFMSLENVKQIPISNYVEFNRDNFACCVWHEEKTPSMKYYPENNNVYCYGCNRYGDVIDVIKQLKRVDFKEALSILQNK